MGSRSRDEVGPARRWWHFPLAVLVLAVGVVAGAAAGLMPVNEAFHSTMINYDVQGRQQAFEQFYTDGVFRYTSGHLVGQFVALCFGAVLVLRDVVPGRRRQPAPIVDPIRTMAVKVAIAMAGGTILALTNLAVTGPLAGARTPPAPPLPDVRAEGMAFDPHLAHDPALIRVVLVGLLAFPLYAAAGCCLGAILARWDRLVAVGLLWWSVGIVGGLGVYVLPSGPFEVPMSLLLPPAGAFAAVAWTASAEYVGTSTPEGQVEWAVACLPLSPVLWALVLFPVWLLLHRRRRAAAAAAARQAAARQAAAR